MSEFRRRLMMGNKTVGNPYITDGLIAMWDGIWNAGLGKHTQSDAGFKDLVSGNTIPVGVYGSWSYANIDSNYTVESNGLKANTRNKHIGIGIPLTFNLGYEYTIEYVRTITQFRSSNVGNCVATHPYNGDETNYRMIENHNYQNSGFRIKGKNDSGGNVSEWIIRNEVLGVEKVSIKLNTNYLMTVMYNNTKYTKTMKIYLTAPLITHLCLNTSGHIATLNCFRIYNRTLSDDEVLHNYNVDLDRF